MSGAPRILDPPLPSSRNPLGVRVRDEADGREHGCVHPYGDDDGDRLGHFISVSERPADLEITVDADDR